MRILLHGKAAANDAVRRAVHDLRDDGHVVEVRVTWEAGDTVRLVAEALSDGVEQLVAGGGDGTLNEVVDGLVEADGGEICSVGLLPLGTANDFARACGIPVADPYAALRLVAEGDPCTIDYGTANGRAFVNVATGGFGTRVTVETPEEMKRVFGGAAYLLTGLRRFNSVETDEGRFRGPGFEWEGEFVAVAVGNSRQAGGGVPLCPDAILDDGLLDLSILPRLDETERLDVLSSLLREGTGAIERRIVSSTLPWLGVEAPGGLYVNLDGEPLHDIRYRFEVRAGRLQFHLPPGAPLGEGRPAG